MYINVMRVSYWYTSQLASDLNRLLISFTLYHLLLCSCHKARWHEGWYMEHTIEDQKLEEKTFYSGVLMGSVLRRRWQANIY